MTSKQREQWEALCLRAVQEPDPTKQMEIVDELNRILQQPRKAQSVPAARALKQRPPR
jgi:hypothetical protein